MPTLELFGLGGLDIFGDEFSFSPKFSGSISFKDGGSNYMEFKKAADTAARTITFPDATDTVALLAATQEFTGKTLNAPVMKGVWTASGTVTLPAITLGGDISLGANKLKTTNLLLREEAATRFGLFLADNTTPGNLLVGALAPQNADFLRVPVDAYIATYSNDDRRFGIRVVDNTVGVVEIMGFQSAADPYVQIGRDDTGVALNAVTDMAVLQAGGGTGNEAANFGLGLAVNLGNAASEVEKRGYLNWVLVDATNASEDVKLDIGLMKAGVLALIGSFDSLGSLTLGVAGTTAGSAKLSGATSGTVTLAVAAAAGTWTMTLPTSVGTAGQQLQTDGGTPALTSWQAAGSLREWKNIISLHDPQDSLDKILNTRAYDFHFKKGMGTGDFDTLYTGVMADGEFSAPWAMHHKGAIVTEISAFGHTVGAIQALHRQIQELETKLAALKR